MAAIDWSWVLAIVNAALALGAVIFVHELGHFAVAKWCGVKCEKFYLGFDVYGLKLAKFQWGETEYGIGIVPFGGYVKMLGQDDNPSRIAEETERAKLQPGEAAAPAAAPAAAAFDPRSYLAKTVPQRMAIISAGVVMNIIFALLTALWAYRLGVEQTPCRIGYVMPGEAAWRADLHVGDEIVRIHDRDQPQFRDLQTQVTLGDLQRGVPLEIRRPGVPETFSVTIFPDKKPDRLAPTIGISNDRTTLLQPEMPTAMDSPAERAEPPLKSGDKIVAIDGQPIETHAELNAALARAPDKTLRVELTRPVPSTDDDKAASPSAAKDGEQAALDAGTERIVVDLPPRPYRTVGLVMNTGKVTAVQANSPAEKAGIQPGDFIETIDDQPPGDPLTLPDRLRRRAGQTVKLTLSREGQSQPVVVSATLRDAGWYETAEDVGHPVAVPALGLAYRALNRVQAVLPDSPAAQAGFREGDEVVKAELAFSEASKKKYSDRIRGTLEIEFSEAAGNWPLFCSRLQNAPGDTQVEFKLADGRQLKCGLMDAADWFNPDRGFVTQALSTTRRAQTLGEAAQLGYREMVDSVKQVYLVIRRMLSSQVSAKALGGPITIARGAGYSAKKGFSDLLLFTCLLSANLAVVNFLPIPLLDGGHMVFLTWEGLRGKPASERIVLAFHYAGFCLILSLMAWVIYLDVSRLGN